MWNDLLFLFSLKVQVLGVPVSCVCGVSISLSWAFFPYLVVYKIIVHLIVDDNLQPMKYNASFFHLPPPLEYKRMRPGTWIADSFMVSSVPRTLPGNSRLSTSNLLNEYMSELTRLGTKQDYSERENTTVNPPSAPAYYVWSLKCSLSFAFVYVTCTNMLLLI